MMLNPPPESTSIVLPQGLSARSAVPLAAILLEYPVAYCPPATVVSPFLSSVVLDVYKVCLKLPWSGEGGAFPSSNQSHSILQFSCPSVLGTGYPELLSPELVVEKLQSFFDSRIRMTDWIQTVAVVPVVIVHHSIETLDRVAL